MDRAARGTWGAVALVVLATGSADAGVEVREEAARTGSYGLRAEVAEGCRGEERLVAVGGERVVLGDGFSVEEGGALVVGVTGVWSWPCSEVFVEAQGSLPGRIRWIAARHGPPLPRPQ